jgi:peroxiredoxin
MTGGTTVLVDEHDRVHELVADRQGDTLVIDASSLAERTGWSVKPEGLCRDAVCLPRTLWPGLTRDDGVDAATLAAALMATVGQPVVVDLDAAIIGMGTPAVVRRAAMATLSLPHLDVGDLDGRPVDIGAIEGKKLLVSFASWCGCRHELPGWQQLHAELSGHGFSVVAVAVDEDADDVRPWVDEAGATFPVVLDRDRVVCDALNIRNVPTVTWIDEQNLVVRPNDVAFASDQFKEFHGIDSTDHHAALRRWVLDDERPFADDDVHALQVLPTDDEQLARVHFRVGVELRRRGRADDARRHFEAAGELSPDDFTIRRAALALQGIDPFLSDEFIALWEEWSARGRPYYSFEH